MLFQNVAISIPTILNCFVCLDFTHSNVLHDDVAYGNTLRICGPTVYPKKYAHGFCFVMVIHWLIFPYPSGLLHWHCGNLTIAPVPAKQPWWIWINTSCEFIMNDCITTTKQSTTKPCAYFLGCTVCERNPSTSEFYSQWASNSGHWCILCCQPGDLRRHDNLYRQYNVINVRFSRFHPGHVLYGILQLVEVWVVNPYELSSKPLHMCMYT